MKAEDVDSEKFLRELKEMKKLTLHCDGYHAYVLVSLLQLALKHLGVGATDPNYKAGLTMAKGTQSLIEARSPYVSKVLDTGWGRDFMIKVSLKEEPFTVGSFSSLAASKKYRLALLHQALMMATSWLDEVTDQSIEEVTDTVFKLAEDNLASKEYEVIPKIIKDLDEDKFLK